MGRTPRGWDRPREFMDGSKVFFCFAGRWCRFYSLSSFRAPRGQAWGGPQGLGKDVRGVEKDPRVWGGPRGGGKDHASLWRAPRFSFVLPGDGVDSIPFLRFVSQGDKLGEESKGLGRTQGGLRRTQGFGEDPEGVGQTTRVYGWLQGFLLFCREMV